MPRVAWSHLLVAPIALVALTLVSCFDNPGECPACPAVDSGRIVVEVPRDGLVDSAHVRVDGDPPVTVRRDRDHAFENLSAGTHDVTVIRWFSIDQILTSRTSSLQIRLDRGETRTISFHNDFPRVTWAPIPEVGPATRRRGHGPIALRVG
jgi:hypothetical protein